jgi:hypothetical protein
MTDPQQPGWPGQPGWPAQQPQYGQPQSAPQQPQHVQQPHYVQQPQYAQPWVAQPPQGGAPWTPPPPKPPLTARARRGAGIAGLVGFGLLTLGWSLASLGGGLLLLVGFITSIAAVAGADGQEVARALDVLRFDSWWPVLVAVLVVGIVLWVLGLLASRWILRGHGVQRAWPVTWSAFGVAVVAHWIVSSILGFALQAVGQVWAMSWVSSDATPGEAIGTGVAWLAVGVLVTVLAGAAIGWFSWWWMAHLFRPRADPALAPHHRAA